MTLRRRMRSEDPGANGLPDRRGKAIVAREASIRLGPPGGDPAAFAMDSTAKELEAFRAHLASAQVCIGRQDWPGARAALDSAIAIDALQPKPFDLLADVLARMGQDADAEASRARAKRLRDEQWKRQVEAEVRGQHELIGGPARHEIP